MSVSAAVNVNTKPAALWRRFPAMLYDLLPLLGIWIVGAAVWMLVFHGGDDLQHLASAVRNPLDLVLRDAWLLLLTGAYFVVSWRRVGATIGMRAWKLRVVDAAGERVGWRTGALRFVLALVSLAVLGAGFWMAWFDAERRTFHDRVCNTRVVRL